MKVTQISMTQQGGAGRAAHRLFEALSRESGNDIYFASKDASHDTKHLTIPSFPTQLTQKNALLRRFTSKWKQIQRARIQEIDSIQTYYSDCSTAYRPAHFETLKDSDIIHLHWVAHLLDWQSTLPWLAAQCPLVWTLHDINPLQGIWHYTPESLPQNPRINQWDARTQQLKADVFARIPADRLTFVAPSTWMAEQIRSNPTTQKFQVKTIANTLNTTTFRPIPKNIAREALSIPQDTKVVGFISDDIKDPRKGMPLLLSALAKTQSSTYTLFTAGGRAEFHSNAAFSTIHLGSLQSEELLRLFYSAIDVFVIPSTQDNLPNTVLEAMACGTPCIGFEVGGIPDMIRHDQTGYLVPLKDTEQLATTITRALETPERTRFMGKNARAVVEAEYSYATQAAKHMALYRELLQNSPR